MLFLARYIKDSRHYALGAVLMNVGKDKGSMLLLMPVIAVVGVHPSSF